MNDFQRQLENAFVKTKAIRESNASIRQPTETANINFFESASIIVRQKSTARSIKDSLDYRLGVVLEALDGLATPDGVQPSEVFIKFSRALRVLGTKLGLGPLQDVLKSRGIKWKKSDDKTTIIIYVDNAETGAAQPITRITPEDLDKPNDFEDKLLDMLDFAKGEAPGSFKQKREMIRKQEQIAREIAKSAVPQDTEQAIPQLMSATPGEMAATVAATPK